MQDPGEPVTAGEPAPRFTHGQRIALVITAAVDAEYETWWPRLGEVNAVSLLLPGDESPSLHVAYGRPGVLLLSPEVLIGAFKDAVTMREPEPACANCEPGLLCTLCAADEEKRLAYEGVLAGLKAAGER